jgi:DNA-directed RNA polymerase beta subunit
MNTSGDIKNQDELLNILDMVLVDGGLINSHIDSFNHFLTIGIKQIMTQVFEMKYEFEAKDTIEHDKTIQKYSIEFIINDVDIHHPVNYDYIKQENQIIFPNEALLKDLTYCSPIYINATITANAYHINGMVSTKTEHVKNLMIAKIPIMVKSKLCNTYQKSKETLIKLHEDPSDQGGYFIIKGNPYVVNNLESSKFNEPREFKKIYKNETARSDIISKTGDAFENSYSMLIKLLNNKSIVINLGKAGFKDIDIPFFVIFRALGITSNKKIVELITYSLDETDIIVKQMLDILREGFKNKYSEFDGINTIMDTGSILDSLIRMLPQYDTYKIKDIKKTKNNMSENDLNLYKFITNKLLQNLDTKFLTHIGLTIDDRYKKAIYLGYMIHRLLLVQLEVLPSTDRDSYNNKRINDSGTAYSKVLKTQFNFMFVLKTKRQSQKEFKNNSFVDIRLASILKDANKAEDFEKALMNATTSGNKTITVNKLTFNNRLSSQQLHPKNKLNVLSILKNIDSPNKNDSSKSSDRAITIRGVHPTGTGYICGITSADTGTKVGMSKQLSISADISPASSSEVLKNIINQDTDLISVNDSLKNYRIFTDNLHKIFVNGDWLGCTSNFKSFLNKYKQKRRLGEIHYLTTISHKIECNEVHLWVDNGRLVRPLLIVYNNIEEKDYTHEKYKQWSLITQDIINNIKNKKIGVDDLIKTGIIEFISPEEHTNCLIAFEWDYFIKNINNPLKRFTHIDIPQGIIGLVALTSVFANHNQPHRGTFHTNQIKQCNSWPMKNWPYVAHKDLYVQISNENPLVSTIAYKHIPPMGINAIVAITAYGGYNQEDSLIINKSSVERGMFDALHMSFQKTDCEQNEIICKPDPTITSEIKSYANYEKLINGIIPEGIFVEDGDCLVGKVVKLSKSNITDKNFIYTDKSMIYKGTEPAYVWKVIHSYNNDEKIFVKIIFKTFRKAELGNKFCVPETNEVLTDSGWKMFKDLDMNDKICSLVNETNIKYVEPTGIYHFNHDGEMININSTYIQSTTTLNHKLYIKESNNKLYKLTEANDVYNKKIQFKKNGLLLNNAKLEIKLGKNTYNMDILLTLLGICIPLGSLHKIYKIIYINIVSEININLLKDLCKKLQINLNYNKYVGYYIINIDIYNILINSINSDNHYLPKFILELNQKQSYILLETLLKFSNSKFSMINHISLKVNKYYYTSNYRLANDISILAFHSGYSGDIYIKTNNEYKFRLATSTNELYNANFYEVNIVKFNNQPIINGGITKYINRNNKTFQKINYTGMISCVEVPSHIFYMREKGIAHWTGNSNRAGQKGICGFLYDDADMPVTKDGMKPDIIFNTLSLVTRMTTGVIFEGMMAKLAAHLGVNIDATIYKKIDTDNIADQLEKYGFKRDGTERMYNGMTGNYMDAEIFIAPLYYQTLQKYTSDTVYANGISPTDVLTNQPLHGKKIHGGARMGSMETACLSVSAPNFLHEKITEHSDKFDLYVCTKCNNRATVNENYDIYRCKYCMNNSNIQKVKSTYTARLFMNEMQGSSVGLKLKLSKPIYEEAEELKIE